MVFALLIVIRGLLPLINVLISVISSTALRNQFVGLKHKHKNSFTEYKQKSDEFIETRRANLDHYASIIYC